MTSATALGDHEAAAAACLRQATANFERGLRAFKIHVFPLKGQELALPQAGGDGQYVEGLHSVPLDRIEEHPHLIPREGLHLLSAGLWRFHGLRLLAEANPVWDLPVALVYFVGNVSFFVLFCAFPDGHFVPRWTRWAAAVWIAYHLLYHFFPDSLFSPQSWPVLINIPLFLGLIGSLVVAQVYRYRRVSNLRQRQQTKWVVFGFTVAIVVFFGVVLALLVSSPTVVNALVSRTIVYLLCAPLIPLSIGVAILYYRLWDIDLIIRRSLVIGPLLTVLTVAFELANELLLPFIFQFIPALDDSSSINTVVSVLIVVVLLKPLHDRLEAIVKRIPDRFFGGVAANEPPQ